MDSKMSEDSTAAITEYLTGLTDERGPELGTLFEKFLDLYNTRLWHQLSKELTDFVKTPPTSPEHFLWDFYKKFVAKLGKSMNPLTFVQVAIRCNRGADSTTAMTFLEELPFTTQADKEAALYVQIERAHVFLTNTDPKVKGPQECLKLLKKSQGSLMRNPEMEDVVHANYYRVLLQYDKLMKNHTSFYKNAFKYLVHCDYDELLPDDRKMLAEDLAVTGLGSADIFCYDDLLNSQLWKDAAGDQKIDALTEVLKAVNVGDILRFRETSENKHLPQAITVDVAKAILEQKIRVTALMDLVFNLPLMDRCVKFADVSKRCELVNSEVERLVMHALSKELVGGSIDQVKQEIQFTYVAPRNLGLDRVKVLTEKAGDWLQKIKLMETVLEAKSEDLTEEKAMAA